MSVAERLYDEAIDHFQRATHLHLLVATDGTPNEDMIVQRLSLTDGLAAEIKGSVHERVQAKKPELGFREYEAGYKPEPEEISVITLGNDPVIDTVVAYISNVNAAAAFEEDPDIIRSLSFYSYVVGADPAKQFISFRNFSPRQELTKKGIPIRLQRGVYDRLEERVFQFDPDFDCFAWKGKLFIRDVKKFQTIFGYFEQLREQALQTIAEVTTRIPIYNADVFEDACTNSTRMLAKLAVIAKQPYLSSVTMKDIKKTIKQCNLDVEIVTDKGVEKIVFEGDPKHRWLILKLLDDDFLGSIMTGRNYAANSKSAI